LALGFTDADKRNPGDNATGADVGIARASPAEATPGLGASPVSAPPTPTRGASSPNRLRKSKEPAAATPGLGASPEPAPPTPTLGASSPKRLRKSIALKQKLNLKCNVKRLYIHLHILYIYIYISTLCVCMLQYTVSFKYEIIK
jgi:hypothetical protein